jgi:sRNA-binding protein
MAPILELIRKNAVPVNVMRSAALGSLPISSDETLEVLVYLTNNPLFGQDARMTLARWDAQSAMEVLGKETTAPEVLLYFWQEQNRRPGLMPTLIENQAIPENLLMELAGDGPREIVNMLLASARARALPSVVEALSANEYVTPAEAEALRSSIAKPAEQTAAPDELADAVETSPEVEAAHKAFEQEHAAEIAAEEGKPFELVKEEETPPEADAAVAEGTAATVADPPQQEPVPAAAPQAAPALDEFDAAEQKRITVLQKVSRLNVGQRIKLGFIGGREERAILIRDTARLVQNAVLSSPKVTDAEVETFAGSKNLQENVFREIARQRRFIKLYPVVRNLVNNPKCPLDISLTLIKTLMVYDLKSLRHNKNVPDTIRKVAAKLYTEKATRGGKN